MLQDGDASSQELQCPPCVAIAMVSMSVRSVLLIGCDAVPQPPNDFLSAAAIEQNLHLVRPLALQQTVRCHT